MMVLWENHRKTLGKMVVLWENHRTTIGKWWYVPSGKHTKNYRKIHPFLMGKSTISTGPFSIAKRLPEGMSYGNPHHGKQGYIWLYNLLSIENHSLWWQQNSSFDHATKKENRVVDLTLFHPCSIDIHRLPIQSPMAPAEVLVFSLPASRHRGAQFMARHFSVLTIGD